MQGWDSGRPRCLCRPRRFYNTLLVNEEVSAMTVIKMLPRRIKQQVSGRPAVDGAGVRLVRVLGSRTVADFDPFLLLDAFDATDPDDYTRGFPMHPHRGIETVTYLAEGRIEHEDSLGNKGVIVSGSCQWMTAGKGILHQEMPKASPRMLGLQLWVNLPKKDKMVPPKYRDITPDSMPVVREPGVEVRVLSGEYRETAGAMRADYVNVTFLEIMLDPGASWSLATKRDDTLFIYVLEGDCNDESGAPVNKRQAVLFTPGDSITLKGGHERARLVVVAGKPLGEPVAWGGPSVMNTDEELKEAFMQLEDGTFITK